MSDRWRLWLERVGGKGRVRCRCGWEGTGYGGVGKRHVEGEHLVGGEVGGKVERKVEGRVEGRVERKVGGEEGSRRWACERLIRLVKGGLSPSEEVRALETLEALSAWDEVEQGDLETSRERHMERVRATLEKVKVLREEEERILRDPEVRARLWERLRVYQP